MYIYLLTNTRPHSSWDVFDKILVVASDEHEAKGILPSYGHNYYEPTWCDSEHVKAEKIGDALPRAVVGRLMESYKSC